MKRIPAVLAGVSFLAFFHTGCNNKTAQQAENSQTTQAETTAQAKPADCRPLETRDPSSPDQKPTFKEQNRACGIKSETAYEVVVVAKGLDKPWAVEPLPNGDLLITEKPGQMRIVSASGQVGKPLTGLPAIEAGGQGGLLDVALSPNFASDRTIYWSFTEPRKGGNGTAVARGVLSKDNSKVEQARTILSTKPTYNNNMHYGSRLTFGQDGMLYVTMGERSDLETRPQAQDMNSHLGKILRITTEGKPAPGNPFLNQAGSLPEIWTVGHRNVQSAAMDENGNFWIVEMGPKGGDELNLIEKGKNYGWPLVTFGEEYSGKAVPNAVTTKAGYVDPVYYWDPVIAPSGAQVYTGSAFPEWKGNLFVGGLKDQLLVRLKLENNKVTGEEHLLTDRDQRIRDVRQGPDGALYVVTDQSNGELWKIVPRK